MPFVDIIERPKDWNNLTEEERGWIKEDSPYPSLRMIENDSTRRLDRAILAAQTSARAGGAVLPEAKGYKLPPLVTGLDIVKMGEERWKAMVDAASWASLYNSDAAINLDHPDVKAAL